MIEVGDFVLWREDYVDKDEQGEHWDGIKHNPNGYEVVSITPDMRVITVVSKLNLSISKSVEFFNLVDKARSTHLPDFL